MAGLHGKHTFSCVGNCQTFFHLPFTFVNIFVCPFGEDTREYLLCVPPGVDLLESTHLHLYHKMPSHFHSAYDSVFFST